MKSWTYAEITASAEAQIRRLMAKGDPYWRQWAYGTYISWYALTVGWQDEGDNERLKSMTAVRIDIEAGRVDCGEPFSGFIGE